MNVDKDAEAQSVLLGELKLKRRESVKLSTEEDFEKLEGSFRFVAKETVICLIIVIGLLAVLVWRGH